MAAQPDNMNVLANLDENEKSSTLDVEEQLDAPKEPVRTVHGLKVATPKMMMLIIVAACYHNH